MTLLTRYVFGVSKCPLLALRFLNHPYTEFFAALSYVELNCTNLPSAVKHKRNLHKRFTYISNSQSFRKVVFQLCQIECDHCCSRVKAAIWLINTLVSVTFADQKNRGYWGRQCKKGPRYVSLDANSFLKEGAYLNGQGVDFAFAPVSDPAQVSD